jgi:hypothetical protein
VIREDDYEYWVCKYSGGGVSDRGLEDTDRLDGGDIVREFGLSETSEPVYQITRRHVSDNRNPNTQPLWERPNLIDLS